MSHPEFPVISFLLVPLVLAPLSCHIRAGNVSIISLIVWLTVMNIIRGVNSIAWAGNVDIKLVVWCDITTKILLGFTYAVPAAALCILRQLEAVSSSRYVSFSPNDKRKRQIFEAIMCFVVPLIFMALHYVVQGHRFDLAEDLGCTPAVYMSIPAILILWFPPLLISTVSAIYAILSLRHFLRNRIAFATHLQNSQSAISQGRYFRLMALAIVEIAWDTGINIYLVYLNVHSGLFPWTNWNDVHFNFSRIAQYPNFLVPQEVINANIFEWWIVPISSIFFIIFFGFGGEAVADYKAAFAWIARTIFRRRASKPPMPLPFHSPKPRDSDRGHQPWDSLSFQIPDLKDDDSVPPYQALSSPKSTRPPSLNPVNEKESLSPFPIPRPLSNPVNEKEPLSPCPSSPETPVSICQDQIVSHGAITDELGERSATFRLTLDFSPPEHLSEPSQANIRPSIDSNYEDTLSISCLSHHSVPQ